MSITTSKWITYAAAIATILYAVTQGLAGNMDFTTAFGMVMAALAALGIHVGLSAVHTNSLAALGTVNEVARQRLDVQKAMRGIAPVLAVLVMLPLTLMGCSTIQSGLGNISNQNLIDFSAATAGMDGSFKAVIDLCVNAAAPIPQCAQYKSQIKAASEAATALFDNGDSLIDAGGSGTGSEISAILVSVVSDLTAYSVTVTDLHTGTAKANPSKRMLSTTQIVDIIEIAIPLITSIANQVEQAINSGTPSTAQIDVSVHQLDADNAVIQAW